jgi:hypothetical protein
VTVHHYTATPQDYMDCASASLTDARSHLLETAKFVDAAGSARFHMELMEAIANLDDLKARIEEHGS